MNVRKTAVLIIGSGVAGLTTAIQLAKKGIPSIVLSSGSEPTENNSSLAQGGISILGEHDTTELFLKDILQAGCEINYPRAVLQLVTKGPYIAKELLIEELKVPFDRKGKEFHFTKEGGHSTSRILHKNDRTGLAIMQKLLKVAATFPEISLIYDHMAIDLITLSHHSSNPAHIYEKPTCVGAYVLDVQNQTIFPILASETILATGGVGETYLYSTNCSEARGDGIAMAYRAGVRIMNMEYVQFHPTTLYCDTKERFLLTEALRGEGAKLLKKNQLEPIDIPHPYKDLAPRDIVARAIFDEMVFSRSSHIYLDISFKRKEWIQTRFPMIVQQLALRGIDCTEEPIPVVPAAHYLCGGIAVDLEGKTTMHRLRAIGEVSCTGVHGANRLASTSLLEGITWGALVAHSMEQTLSFQKDLFPDVKLWEMGKEECDQALIEQDWKTLQQTMWNYVGLKREKRRLLRALKMLSSLKWEIQTFYEEAKLTKEFVGLRNAVEVGLLITQGAMRNPHSIGCHYLQEQEKQLNTQI